MRKTRLANKAVANDTDLSDQDMAILYDPELYNRIAQLLEEKLTKQKENFNNQILQLSTLLREGEMRIMERMNDAVKEIESKLLTEVDKKFCELREDLIDVTERVSKLETVTSEISELKKEIKQMKAQHQKYSNSLVACDLRFNGVPFNTGENLNEIFDSVCKSIKINTPKLQSISRIQGRNNNNNAISPDGAIIAKCMTPLDRNSVLKAINCFRKEGNKLNLNLLGFDSDGRNQQFYVHENLTNDNFKILREALNLKRQRRIHSAYSYRGLVYIKRTQDDKPNYIDSLDTLNGFFCSNESRSSISYQYTHRGSNTT